jgi:hypothetical protein
MPPVQAVCAFKAPITLANTGGQIARFRTVQSWGEDDIALLSVQIGPSARLVVNPARIRSKQ